MFINSKFLIGSKTSNDKAITTTTATVVSDNAIVPNYNLKSVGVVANLKNEKNDATIIDKNKETSISQIQPSSSSSTLSKCQNFKLKPQAPLPPPPLAPSSNIEMKSFIDTFGPTKNFITIQPDERMTNITALIFYLNQFAFRLLYSTFYNQPGKPLIFLCNKNNDLPKDPVFRAPGTTYVLKFILDGSTWL
jgi:hypothetical protein